MSVRIDHMELTFKVKKAYVNEVIEYVEELQDKIKELEAQVASLKDKVVEQEDDTECQAVLSIRELIQNETSKMRESILNEVKKMQNKAIEEHRYADHGCHRWGEETNLY